MKVEEINRLKLGWMVVDLGFEADWPIVFLSNGILTSRIPQLLIPVDRSWIEVRMREGTFRLH